LDQHEPLTVVTTETPTSYDGTGIPFYPIIFGSAQETYNQKYRELAKREKHTTFVGRLATYKYLDMWVAIKQTMSAIKNLIDNN
jgi:UDP-galactopyranose mutase